MAKQTQETRREINQHDTEIDEEKRRRIRHLVLQSFEVYKEKGLILLGSDLKTDGNPFIRDYYHFQDSSIRVFLDTLIGTTTVTVYSPGNTNPEQRTKEFLSLFSKQSQRGKR